MSEPEKKSQGRGFKGLQSMGSKSPEPLALPDCKSDTPALLSGLEETKSQQAAQPRPSQSQTAAPPSRGWLIGMLIVGAVVFFIVWADNQSSSSRLSSAPSSTGYSPNASEPAPAELPYELTITIPPVGNDLLLTSDQIRYCVYENRRIKGAEKVVNNNDETSVSMFNVMVDDYNSRCSHFQYRQGALTPIQSEANQIQAQLEQEGRERIVSAHS